MADHHEEQAPRCARRYTETEWVDCLLGHLDPLQKRDMEAHLTVCPACRDVHEEWTGLLGMQIDGAGASVTNQVREAAAAGVTVSAGIPHSAFPSEQVRLSLRQAAARRSLTLRLRRPALWASAGAAAVVLLLLLAGALKQDVTPASGGRYVELHEPRAAALLHAPETAAYRVQSSASSIGGGYVWLNGDRQEAVLLLDDLPAFERFDYRAWALSGGQYVNLGLLEVDEGRAHLYVKGPFLQSPDNIAVSAEPKGGGQQPASEDTIVVIVHRR